LFCPKIGRAGCGGRLRKIRNDFGKLAAPILACDKEGGFPPSMEPFYESEKVRAFWHAEGYLELVVFEESVLEFSQLREIGVQLAELGHTNVRALVSRVNRYVPPSDYLLRDLATFEPVIIERVAYFAPTPTSQTLSHVVGVTALKGVPYRVFPAREQALEWLMES
jgi:hypothetical protein